MTPYLKIIEIIIRITWFLNTRKTLSPCLEGRDPPTGRCITYTSTKPVLISQKICHFCRREHCLRLGSIFILIEKQGLKWGDRLSYKSLLLYALALRQTFLYISGVSETGVTKHRPVRFLEASPVDLLSNWSLRGATLWASARARYSTVTC